MQCLSLAVLLAFAAPYLCELPPANAQSKELIDLCNRKENVLPDRQIEGCTALIKSGEYSGKILSLILDRRGYAYYKRSDKGRAMADFDHAILLDPQNALAYMDRCKAYLDDEKYDRAADDCTISIALNSSNAGPWAYIGDAYHHFGEVEQAIKNFGEAIKRNPEWMWPYNNRGELYLDRGDFDLAIRDFDDVVRVAPAWAMGWNNRCRALAIVGRLGQALSDCERALKIDPNFKNYMEKSGAVSAIQHRGLVRLKSGFIDSAIEDLDKAYELTPNSAEVLFTRGIAKLKKGDTLGGTSDINAAKTIQADIAGKLAKYGVN